MFMHLGKIHLCEIRHQQWEEAPSDFFWQSNPGCLPFIFRVCSRI
jgi:hypothetical protein